MSSQFKRALSMDFSFWEVLRG